MTLYFLKLSMHFSLMSSNDMSTVLTIYIYFFFSHKEKKNTTVYYPIRRLLKQTASFYIQALHVSILQIYPQRVLALIIKNIRERAEPQYGKC